MMTSVELSKTWNLFVVVRECKEKDNETYIKLRNKLLSHYYPIVFKVAENMHKKLKEVEIDDLITWGTDGLFHAVEKFRPDLNNKFETYAIHRIRGAVLDNIRKVDWVPRLVRQRHSQLNKLIQKLESELNRQPTKSEIAAQMGMSEEEFEIFEEKATPIGCVSMYANSSSADDDCGGAQIEDLKTSDNSPSDSILRQEMFQKLLGRYFIPLERKIIHLHYYENMSIKEVSEKIGISESRISQMHVKIIERLQKKIEANPEYMNGLHSILGN
jgi:RNA polymerase sigma factor for flagellar operon FliA